MANVFLKSAIVLSIALASPSGYAMAQGNGPKDCPPGLAKKNNGCLPPGLAKKYILGQPLPYGVEYEFIYDRSRYGLPRVDGDWLYVLLGNEILRVADKDSVVLDVVRILSALDQ
ncbi:MAG TPA: hypothetical protein VLA51_10895 [Paracoccaceae bacterium]|nr:hypothetical protein [Paracoccaceae bacterium]